MGILVEDRKTIEQTVDFICQYMASKKSHPLYGSYVGLYMTFHKSVIVPWMDETVIYERDYSPEEETEMVNRILDFFNVLEKIFGE